MSGRGDEFDRMAESINDMLDRIARLMDGVRQVSNAIAHDLRTPITRARARLEDAALHARSETELRAAWSARSADLDGVTAVFHALMRIAEIEVGARRSAFAEIDLRPLLADLADLYGAVAEEHGLTLRLDVPDTLTILGRSRPAAAGGRQPARQRDQVLARRRADRPVGGARRARVRLSVRIRGPASRKPTGRAPPNVSSAARPPAARPGSGLGLALVQAVAVSARRHAAAGRRPARLAGQHHHAGDGAAGDEHEHSFIRRPIGRTSAVSA